MSLILVTLVCSPKDIWHKKLMWYFTQLQSKVRKMNCWKSLVALGLEAACPWRDSTQTCYLSHDLLLRWLVELVSRDVHRNLIMNVSGRPCIIAVTDGLRRRATFSTNLRLMNVACGACITTSSHCIRIRRSVACRLVRVSYKYVEVSGSYRDKKCANTAGTVPVSLTGHFQH